MSENNKFILEIGIQTDEKLIIGTGQMDFRPSRFQQIQKVKVGEKYKPVIPATSIKGVLRTNAMKIAHLLGLKSCGKIKPEDITQAHKSTNCHVCSIFGAPNIPSKIIVEDAISKDKEIIFDKYTGIKLNSKSRVTEKGALFQYEAVGIGQNFQFNIICEGLTTDESKLLTYAIRELQIYGIGRYGGSLKITSLNLGELPDEVRSIAKEAFENE
ncbi:MAG: hypothetical protein HWN67_02380 [Candidatus Helarchaeota archaeon]|nr:hypothetical protein [Candidatus Helarchaeota archaeon]